MQQIADLCRQHNLHALVMIRQANGKIGSRHCGGSPGKPTDAVALAEILGAMEGTLIANNAILREQIIATIPADRHADAVPKIESAYHDAVDEYSDTNREQRSGEIHSRYLGTRKGGRK
jgi:hypothetical protein